jgi:DNA-binding transcriptional ArsR family regulator
MTASPRSSSSPLEVIRRAGQARTLLDPTRRALLEGLGEPGSAASLARRLGVPRQRLNYHLRELERQGLVELVEERRRGNCVERIVRASARHYLISPEALGALGSTIEERQDRASAASLVAAAGSAIRTVGSLGAHARGQGKRLATLTLEADVRFRSAADRNAFAEELANALARLAAKYHDAAAPGGRAFRFLVAGYPAAPPLQPAAPKEEK